MSPGRKSLPIVLAGRSFVRVERTTLEHDEMFIAALKRYGVTDPTMGQGETPEAFSWRLLTSICEAHGLGQLLGFLIVPAEDVASASPWWKRLLEELLSTDREPRARGWTPELQRETAALINALEDPREKSRVYELVAELFVPFLRTGLASWAGSLPSGRLKVAPVSHPVMSLLNGGSSNGVGSM